MVTYPAIRSAEAKVEETVMDLVHRLLPSCKPVNIPDHIKLSAQRLRSEVELHPLDISRRFQLACLLLQLKNYHEASEVCVEARTKDTRRTLAQLPLLHGLALMLQRRHSEAEMCFSAYTLTRPSRFEGELMSAINAFAANDSDEADRHLAAALALEPRRYHTRLARARFLECRRTFTEAIKLYEEVLREDPENSEISKLLHKAVARNKESQRFNKDDMPKHWSETGEGISFGR
jgi:predicted Zn-dependent protease